LFEILTLIQTGEVQSFPVVLMGREYWAPLIRQLNDMVGAGTIGATDLDLLLITDDVAEALAHVQARAITPFGLKPRTSPHPWAVFGERGRPTSS
jgi:predicted Rossmann-fold nucleotide-binding protein